MTPIDTKKLFLGKQYDIDGNMTEEPLLYRPENLNTHCVIAGMTGSGKTGLGIIMLEELALKNIPAIIIDPKGDLTNLLLHFPELQPEDFEPWIDPEAPAREGKELAVLASEQAQKWQTGLSQWGLGKEDLEALKKVSYTVYTPGSTVGNPVNIMASFNPPPNRWTMSDEDIREMISTSVTALLDLVGISNIDPIQSREHILISTIIEQYWNMNKSVDIEELVNTVNNPPFEKLGALPVDKMFPPKDRFQLSMLLNNFLASPSFQSWSKGPELDIGKMQFKADGRARFNIFYIQHLSEHERMFFVTMLYSKIESWMKTQSGTGNLRLGVYFDEIAGYLPASGNPASRGIIIRMLKQARAFGVGLILSSQNPIDFDYKALSNAGTWMVGRLQTEQDKNRLIDGLTTNAGAIDRQQANRLISALKNRQFLYMNVHEPGLKVFSTRWVLNYLAGPLTRNLIPKLIEMGLSESNAGNETDEQAALPTDTENLVNGEEEGTGMNGDDKMMEGAKPEVASTIGEYYHRVAKTLAEADAADDALTYIPVWYAQAEVKINQPKYNLNFADIKAAMVDEEMLRGLNIRWSDYAVDPIDPSLLDKFPEQQDAKFQQPPSWMLEGSSVRSRESDFIDFIYRQGDIRVKANETLGVYAPSTTPDEDFLKMCKDKIQQASETEKKKLVDAYQKVVDNLEAKIRKAQMDVQDKQDKVGSRNLEKYGAFGELLLSLVTGRKRSISTSINKYGLSNNAANALEKANLVLDELNGQLEKATSDFKDQISDLEARWEAIAEKSGEIAISPLKKDIFTDYFGILWLPYYTDRAGKLVKAY